MSRAPFWHGPIWICPNHIPGAKWSSEVAQCAYQGCSSVQPEKPEGWPVPLRAKVLPPQPKLLPKVDPPKTRSEKPVSKERPAPPNWPQSWPQSWSEAWEEEARVQESLKEAKTPRLPQPKPRRPKKTPQTPKPEILKSGFQVDTTETPPLHLKRRGATAATYCSKCGELVWRRPTELDGRKILCSDCYHGSRD